MGLNNQESLTVKSIRDAVKGHLKGLGGEICVGRNRWQKYGMLNRSTGEVRNVFKHEIIFKRNGRQM